MLALTLTPDSNLALSLTQTLTKTLTLILTQTLISNLRYGAVTEAAFWLPAAVIDTWQVTLTLTLTPTPSP